MQQVICLLFLLVSIKGFAQKIIISGTAFDTTKGRNKVHIVVNDTIQKFNGGNILNWNTYRKLVEDTTISKYADNNGKFQITVNRADSLFFQSYRHIQKVYSVSDLLRMENIR
jgi:hypothetical protein